MKKEMKKKYKILFSLSEFMHGSMVKQVCHLVNGLNKDIFEMEICAEDIDDEGVVDIKALNVPFYISPLFPPRSLNIGKWLNYLKSPLFLYKKKFDIIHSLHYASMFTEPLVCKFAKNTKYIYVKSNLQWNNHRLNWYLKSLLSDKIIAQSLSGYKILESKGFSHKSMQIYNGVDCKVFRPPLSEEKKKARAQYNIQNNNFVFGYAAHFIEVKDHITLLKAFKRVKNEFPNIALALCGGPHDEGYYNRVMKFIKDNNLTNNVRPLGTLSDMKSFYAACDCLIFPSKFENFSRVIMEALSSGLPIIASRYGGNIEQITDGENGFLVEPENDVQFANAMMMYLKNPELLINHGTASRKIAETKFSVDMMIKKIEELYLSVLSK